jgi:predicted nuclease of predicted toxin-antitoxin system
VKFLVDAQLPARLADHLTAAGHDSIHTTSLPDANRTTDSEIARIADADGRIVVSKDRDFRDSHLLQGTPQSLLIISTGNINNTDLLALVAEHLASIITALGQAALVELRPQDLVIHDN